MKKLVRLISVWLLLCASAIAATQQVSLTILHTNDTHGRLLPFSYPSASASNPIPEFAGLIRKDIGGIARRATLVKELRDKLGREGTTVWFVDAGDFTDGTPFSSEYQGTADLAAMNAAGYDFSTLGNHEFNRPLAKLRSLLALFRYPVLCANADGISSDLVRESEIREVGPIKIAIFGLVTRSAGRYQAAMEGVKISGELETAKRMVSSLRPRADIVIALSHSGETVDEQIARAVPGVDVIVGGHSHSRIPYGELIRHFEQRRPRDVNGTIMVQAHQWGGELGRLDLSFEKEDNGPWHIRNYRARLVPITSDIPEDPAVAAIVDSYWKPIAARYGEVIGTAANDFMQRENDLTHYNLVADAVRETFQTDIELENMGGIRSELAKGKIRLADLVNMDPFSDAVVTFRISGKQLKELLAKDQPAVSGIKYRVKKGNLVKAKVGGRTVTDEAIYTGATTSFFAEMFLQGISTVDTGKQRIDVFADYVRKKGVVRPSYDGRRVIIP
jgi:5'-nucleotidase / UDP-sugar diphosphatase